MQADNTRKSLTRNVRRTRKRRSVFSRSLLTLLAEITTRLLEVKVQSSLDLVLQETTMMIS